MHQKFWYSFDEGCEILEKGNFRNQEAFPRSNITESESEMRPAGQDVSEQKTGIWIVDKQRNGKDVSLVNSQTGIWIVDKQRNDKDVKEQSTGIWIVDKQKKECQLQHFETNST